MLSQFVMMIDKDRDDRKGSIHRQYIQIPGLRCNPAGLYHYEDCAAHRIKRRKAFCISYTVCQSSSRRQHSLAGQRSTTSQAAIAKGELAPPVPVSFSSRLCNERIFCSPGDDGFCSLQRGISTQLLLTKQPLTRGCPYVQEQL